MLLEIEIPAEIEAALQEEANRRGLEDSDYIKSISVALRRAAEIWNAGTLMSIQEDDLQRSTSAGWEALALLRQALPEGWEPESDEDRREASKIALAGGAFFSFILTSMLLGKGGAKDPYLPRLTVDDLLSRRAADVIGRVQAEADTDEEVRELVASLLHSQDELDTPAKEAAASKKRSLLSFRGAAPWDGTDAQERVNALRDEWDERGLREAATAGAGA